MSKQSLTKTNFFILGNLEQNKFEPLFLIFAASKYFKECSANKRKDQLNPPCNEQAFSIS